MEHFSHDIWHLGVQVSAVVLIFCAIVVAWRDLFAKKRLPGALSRLDHLRRQAAKWVSRSDKPSNGRVGPTSTIDTIFVLPDISGYSGLVATFENDIEKAREPVFALMNAMMDGVGADLHLSKVDGDAVLFYADAAQNDPARMGKVVSNLFTAFDKEKDKLVRRFGHDQELASSIDQLDVKVVIHRGDAVRYAFGSSVDHFGAAVTLIYKLLKNDLHERRYILRTEPAASVAELPGHLPMRRSTQDVGELGRVEIDVFLVPKFEPTKVCVIPVRGRNRRSSDRLEVVRPSEAIGLI